MRSTLPAVLLFACVGMGCAEPSAPAEPLIAPPPMMTAEQGPAPREVESLDDLVRTINDNPDILHADYTPSVNKLIKVGEPAIPRMLDLMLSDDPGTRLHAIRVLECITLAQHGFVSGQGWPSGDNHKEEARVRAFWKSLGDLDWEASREDRERSVKLWRAWLGRNKA